MKLRHTLFALLFTVVSASALAQGFPNKPISIVVPYAPGGTNDIIARLVANRMTENLGQPVIVENKPGAGGNVGAAYVARAAADGYTLLMAPVGILAINKYIYKNAGFDPDRDFTPITAAGSVPNVLLVSPQVPARNMEELLKYVKANPGKVNFASMGSGTTGHLSGEMFKMLGGLDLVHVPYKGSSPAMADLLGGHVQMMFDNLPTALPQIKTGKVLAFAVTSTTRHPTLPDVPTLSEAGVNGFDATAWFGFVAPSATPKPVIDKLNAEIVKALQDPGVRTKMDAQGVHVIGNSSQEFKAMVASESIKWKKVVDRSGARAD
jgi:tripartite-type tricarboxylate transporter receptor subunit TctC